MKNDESKLVSQCGGGDPAAACDTVTPGGEKAARAERAKTWAAWLLLSLPLFEFPLAWAQMFRGWMPHWSRFTIFSLQTLAPFAVAVLLLTGVSELRRKCRVSRLSLLLAAGAVALMVLAPARALYTGRRLEPLDLYLPLLPLAGMALSREVMRILPRWGTFVLAVLIAFTLRFPKYCYGLPGNWNWNLSLLAVLLPAPFLLWRHDPRQFWMPVLAAAVFLGAFSLLRPELTPRGVIVGVIVASAALWLLWKLPRRQRIFITILGGGAGIAMFLSICLGPADSANRDSRIWLWRGSMELALRKGMLGVGGGRFEREINPYLPKEYYFSEHATNLHTHPHNELLAEWCEFGVPGVFFVMVLTLAAVSGLRNYSSTMVWATWLFIVLSVHGQVDVLLKTPLAGTVWLVVGGALAGVRSGSGGVPHPKLGVAGVLAALALTAIMSLASWFYRESRISYDAGDGYIARKNAEKSLSLWENPDVRLFAGKIELLKMRDPRAAIRHFGKLAPGYVHSNLYMGWAYVDMGAEYAGRGTNDDALRCFKEALRCFDTEDKYYPMSALNADVELEVMKKLGEDEVSLVSRKERLQYLLKLRGVTIEELRADHALDDLPLRNP